MTRRKKAAPKRTPREKAPPRPTIMSIAAAAAAGITKLRRENWAFRDDHIELDLIDGKLGPWFTLHLPTSAQLIGAEPTQRQLLLGHDLDEVAWEPYA